MTINIGSTNILKVYLGSVEINKIYVGDSLAYQKALNPITYKPIKDTDYNVTGISVTFQPGTYTWDSWTIKLSESFTGTLGFKTATGIVRSVVLYKDQLLEFGSSNDLSQVMLLYPKDQACVMFQIDQDAEGYRPLYDSYTPLS